MQKIPKRIIQIWGGERDLPLICKASSANVKLLNPDFEYLLFDDTRMSDFINERCSEYRKVFDAFRFPIQRYDFFRYLAVYHIGGFYFDTDFFLVSNLSELLDFECVFPFEELTMNHFLCEEYGMDWEVGNYAFGATAGHPFIHAIIKNCIRAQRDKEWTQAILRSIPRLFREEFLVYYTTGPGLVSRTLAEYPDAAAQVKVLFPENVCDQKHWYKFGNYGIHLMGGSWRERKGILRKRLSIIWSKWKRRRILKEALKLGASRSLEFKQKV